MESTPVNWEVLDALVTDFAKSECLIEDLVPSSSSSPQSASSSSIYRSRSIIKQIRRSLEVGNIHDSIDLLLTHATAILDDRRMAFQLQQQKFIELLRKGTVEDRDSAVSCLRATLAPCAMDAYPEAYEEFKHTLLTLIYDKDDESSPVVEEWSEKKRGNIAGLVSSLLRAHFQVFDPLFSMTLRYLISIHKEFKTREGTESSSSISEMTERLLVEERDPTATGGRACNVVADEKDIQALAHAVKITRQEAVDSLKFTNGDVHRALQNELCRMKLDAPFLHDLVYEYCTYRGIVESECVTDDRVGSCCRTSSSADRRHETASHERRRSKRWRRDNGGACHSSPSSGHKYDALLRITDLACGGAPSDVIIKEVSSVDPDFFTENPGLLFQLKQLEFLSLVRCGDKGGALRVACAYLGPLSVKEPRLLKRLKETLVTLLTSPIAGREDDDDGRVAVLHHGLADSLQVAIAPRLGVGEPRLMKLVKELLATHARWFHIQMCSDRFQSLLMIDSLTSQNPSPPPPPLTAHSQGGEEDADILKVMEFLAVPRSDAISLLTQYNSNPEAIIQHIFS